VLDRGFALITNNQGVPIKRAAAAPLNSAVTIRFVDGERDAVLGTHAVKLASTETFKPQAKKSTKKIFDDDQDRLF
jgi:hypothetical protein